MKTDWRQNILFFTILGMECCWSFALLALINNLIGTPLIIQWLVLLLPLAFIFNKILPWRSRIYLYPVNALAWAIVTLMIAKVQLFSGLKWFEPSWLTVLSQTLKPALLLVGGSVALWWAGWRLARLKIAFSTSVAEFQFGVAMLLFVFLVPSLAGSQLSGAMPIALTFFLFALAGMALARNLDAEEWLAGANRGFWVGFLLAGIGLILVLGMLIGSMVNHNFLELVLVPIRWVMGMVWKGILFLLSLLPQTSPGELPPIEPAPDTAAMEAESLKNAFSIPAWLKLWLNRGYILIFMGLILGAVWRLTSQVLGWLRHRLATTAGAEVESMPGAFRQDLIAWLKRIWFALRHLRLPFWKRESEIYEETSPVRKIYRELLRWTAKSIPRSPHLTPYEYLQLLEMLMPQAQPELRFITEEYVRARYSPDSPSQEKLNRLEETWRRLKQFRLKVAGNESSPEVALNE